MSPERFGGNPPDVATVVGDAGHMRERMQLLEAFFAMVHSVKNLDELASDVIPRGIAANFSEPVGTDLIEDSKIVKYLNLNKDVSPEDIRASISLIKTLPIKSALTRLFFPGSEHAHGTFVSEGGLQGLGIDDDQNDFRTAVAAPTATRKSAPSPQSARPAAHPPTFVDDRPARFVPQRSNQPPQQPAVSQPPESKPPAGGGLWSRIKKGLTGK